MDKNCYAVIMAGGRGERFWPRSRSNRPKQFLQLLGKSTMIEETVRRLFPVCPPERVLVITNAEYVGIVRTLLPDLPPENIVGEPVGRDTGPCAALAAALVSARGGDQAIMMLLPADHVIRRTQDLAGVLEDAAALARKQPEWLFTIGIRPTAPATGYGYIQCGEELPESAGKTRFRRSLGFREKPDRETAERFLSSGDFRWNSGMFLWQVGALRGEFRRNAPELETLCARIGESIADGSFEQKLPGLFQAQPKISIDYAVMEHARFIAVAESRFDWDDVGSWTSLRNHFEADADGNVSSGLFAAVDSRNLIVSGSSDHLVAAIGVDDLVIVRTDDVTLVCPVHQAQRIKELLKAIGQRPELCRFL